MDQEPCRWFWGMLRSEHHRSCVKQGWQQLGKRNMKARDMLPLSISMSAEKVSEPRPLPPGALGLCPHAQDVRDSPEDVIWERDIQARMERWKKCQTQTWAKAKHVCSPSSTCSVSLLPAWDDQLWDRLAATSQLSSATCMNAFPSHWKLPGLPSDSLRAVLPKLSATSIKLKSVGTWYMISSIALPITTAHFLPLMDV